MPKTGDSVHLQLDFGGTKVGVKLTVGNKGAHVSAVEHKPFGDIPNQVETKRTWWCFYRLSTLDFGGYVSPSPTKAAWSRVQVAAVPEHMVVVTGAVG